MALRAMRGRLAPQRERIAAALAAIGDCPASRAAADPRLTWIKADAGFLSILSPMNRRPSIARRLVFLVIVAITPILAFTGILIARYAEMERAGYDEQMLATARALSLAIDREIAAQHAIVLALSGNSDLRDRNWRAFYDRAKSIMGDDTERRIIVFDPSGQQLLNTLIPYGDELPRSDTRPIREVTESRTPYLSNLVVGAVTGRYAIGIYVPIFQDREVPYVLALGFSPDRFSRLLAEQNLAKGWIASVIDRNGIIAARNVFAATLVGQPITSQFLDTMRAKSDGIIKGKSKDGVPSHGAFVRSAVSQWTTVLGVETAILNAPLWRSLWLLGGGGSLLLVVTLGGTALYARRIARPVVALASMAGSMQRDEPLGDLDLDLQEAQFVADQIRNAATQLEERRAEREALLASLELRVEARTRDLADSEARYRLLADNATDLIVHSGMDRIWHYVSPSCRQMLGYEPEEMIGKSPTHLVHPEDSEPLAKAIGQLRPGYERTTAVYRVRRKDGIYVWIETSFNLIIDTKSGRPVSIVSVARDITARKDAEERAERAAAQAITANQAKSEFLASMSHELRTPLNAVIGFAQLLIYGKGPPLVPRQREYVDFILSGANHLLELIKDVLDLAKIESGRLRVSIEWVDVGTLIEEFVAMLRPIAEQKGLSLTSEPLQLRHPAIRADRVRLLQVLMNFGSNAVKYNRPNGSIIVRARPTAEGRLRISVEDTGLGIPPERQGEAFEPFNRLGAEGGAIEGTGIGLTICKRLIELMKGRIAFSSERGKGSEFWVELPEDRTAGPDAAAVAVTGSEELPSDQPGYTVLYVDDNPASLTLMSRLIADLPNARLLTASTGEMGIYIAVAHHPDVVIVDIHLPDMSGYDVLARLKADAETANIPVMALSADAMPSDVARGRAARFARYMTKPLSIPEMIKTIEEIVKSRAD